MTVDASVLDLIGAGLVVIGVLLCLVAAIGLIRLPDVLSRMHAATKPQTLGLLVLLTGLGLSLREPSVVGVLVVIAVLQLLTAPISAHLVARTAYRTRQFRTDITEPDELDRDLAAAGFRLVTRQDDADTVDDLDSSAAEAGRDDGVDAKGRGADDGIGEGRPGRKPARQDSSADVRVSHGDWR